MHLVKPTMAGHCGQCVSAFPRNIFLFSPRNSESTYILIDVLRYNSIELSTNLNRWAYSTYTWENAIREILTTDSLIPIVTTIQEPRSVFRPCMSQKENHKTSEFVFLLQYSNYFPVREVPFDFPLCSTSVTWCTKSLEEKEKCNVIRAAGITTGVYPLIECQEPVIGSIGCLNEVNEGRADFTVIDSNFGYIARQ